MDFEEGTEDFASTYMYQKPTFCEWKTWFA